MLTVHCYSGPRRYEHISTVTTIIPTSHDSEQWVWNVKLQQFKETTDAQAVRKLMSEYGLFYTLQTELKQKTNINITLDGEANSR